MSKNLFIGVLAVLLVCVWIGDACSGESKSEGDLSRYLLNQDGFSGR